MGLALRKRFCRSFNFELQAAATDNGIVISLSDQHSFPLELVFKFLTTETVEDVLTQAMLPAPMFEVRWRWDTSRALAVLRFAGGRKVPPPIQRMRADDLLAAVFPDQAACQENIVGDIRIPDHPLVNETIKDCLYEAMDLDGLKRLLERMASGEMKTVAIDTPEPSPFSHEILNANPYAYLDDAPLEERRARAVQMRRTIGPGRRRRGRARSRGHRRSGRRVVADGARRRRAARRAADADGDSAPVASGKSFSDAARERARHGAERRRRDFWVAAERLKSARLLYPDAVIAPEIQDFDRSSTADRESAAAEALRGWLESTGPQTQSGLAENVRAAGRAWVEAALLRLEERRTDSARPFHRSVCLAGIGNRVVQPPRAGAHSPADAGPAAPRDRAGDLARLHALPLSVAAPEEWAQLHGPDGALHIIKQLQGYEISAAAWEERRAAPQGGQVRAGAARSAVHFGRGGVGTLVAAPGVRRSGARPERRAATGAADALGADCALPSRRCRVAAGSRGEPRGTERAERCRERQGLSDGARQVLESLSGRGASFLADLVRDTHQLTSVVEDALWELAAAGLVTADGFENLRALVDPKRRLATARHHSRRARFVPGRWAVLRSAHGDSAWPRTSADPPDFPPDTLEAIARQLLLRWGVVFRDLLARETIAPPWRDLLVTFRRMEAQGEIRGGRFVSGFVGEQFARPEAVELLREIRRDRHAGDAPNVSAADPLNLAGIVTPGPRVSPLSGLIVPLWQDAEPEKYRDKMGSDPVFTNLVNAQQLSCTRPSA